MPEDEAEEIRTLLRDNEISFHETSSGFLDLMTAAIWVDDEADLKKAQRLLEDYQRQRYRRAREEYLHKQAENRLPGFLNRLRAQPLTMLIYLLLALLLLSLTTLPFWI